MAFWGVNGKSSWAQKKMWISNPGLPISRKALELLDWCHVFNSEIEKNVQNLLKLDIQKLFV